jgi:hypothetical protein
MSDGPPAVADGQATGTDDADEVPVWDDEYLDRVSDRLLVNYDLARDVRVHGEPFDMYGHLRMVNRKQFLHPALSFGHHEQREHVLAARRESVTVADCERLVELGHDLADDWIDADEEHYGTDLTFALVVPAVPDDVAEFVDGFRDRTLLKYGYHGDYEVNLVVVAPEEEVVVESAVTDLGDAFALWRTPGDRDRGLLSRLLG